MTQIRVLLIEEGSEGGESLDRELAAMDESHIVLEKAAGVPAALHRLAEGGVDAVVVDLNPSSVGSVDEALQALTQAAQGPVIAVAGAQDPHWALEAIDYGAQDCLVKQEVSAASLTRAVVLGIARKRAGERSDEVNRLLHQQLRQGSGYVQLLQDVAVIANEADTVEEAFQEAIQRVCRATGWPVGHAYQSSAERDRLAPMNLWHLDDPARFRPFCQATQESPLALHTSLVGRVFATGQPAWAEDVTTVDSGLARAQAAQECGLRSGLAFPVMTGKSAMAVLEFFTTQFQPPDRELLEVMANIGTQLGRVLDRKDLEQRVAELTASEQLRFGLELHDGVAQQLTGIGMMAERLRQKLAADGSAEAESAARLVQYIKETQSHVRTLSQGLMPVVVDSSGLMTALEKLILESREQGGVACEFRCEEPVHVDDNSTATHLYRIAQEAIHNSIQHADAKNITVSLENLHGRVALSVVDDGAATHHNGNGHEGTGQRIMRYRANLIGGTLRIHRKTGGGTVVMCTV